jgi:hypothetical protein
MARYFFDTSALVPTLDALQLSVAVWRPGMASNCSHYFGRHVPYLTTMAGTPNMSRCFIVPSLTKPACS